MLFLPEAELATDNTSGDVVETVIADGAPGSAVPDLQKTFTLHLTSDKSHVCNGHGHSVSI